MNTLTRTVVASLALTVVGEAGAISVEEFIHAATFENNEVVEAGLAEGLDPGLADKWGNSALALAAFDGNDAMVKLLLKHGADVDQAAHDGSTALMLAAQQGKSSTVELLLAANANLELRNTSKQTALLVSIQAEHYAISRLLVDAGANVNIADINRRSAVLLAARSVETVRYLVEHGADPDATELHGGTTTLNYLKRGGDYSATIAYLESVGARD